MEDEVSESQQVDCYPKDEVQAEEAALPTAARGYPSLYDSIPTTFGAIGIGIVILVLVQLVIARVTQKVKTDHMYLTRFVTTLVSLVVGVYIADLLIAGPDTSLLSDSEHEIILHFIKDTCLMVFSYYFGLKAQAPTDNPADSQEV